MADLVLAKKNEVFADSRVVADKFGKRHNDFVKSIERLIDNLGEIKLRKSSYLKFTKKQTEYRGQTFDYYEMNKPAFSLLVMGLTGKKALEWKLRFNDAFYEMERQITSELLNKQSELWLAQREQSRQIRKEETDIIKDFVEYATKQGSAKAQFYYKHITVATYKCLGLVQYQRPKLRETLDMMQTSQLIMAEMVAQKSLQKYMQEGEHYKTIFTLVKQDLEQFADSFLMNRLKG